MDTTLDSKTHFSVELEAMRNILVVDDDSVTLFALKACLESRGFIVHSATSVGKAIQILQQVQVQLFLIDVCLPEEDGFSLCKQIRAMPAYKKVPIYMLTGLTDSLSIDIAFASGADDYIAKPIDLRILGRRLEVAFDNYALNLQTATEQSPTDK
jgi:PleD family two-component response regulator